MLKSIVRFSLRHRGIVIALACAWLFYGVYSLRVARYDVFPNFAPPQVSIQAEAPGLSPEQVEQLVTTPIENAIIGVAGVQTVRSGSIQGLSVITVIFQNKGNIYLDRQVVAERLATLTGQLPAGVTPVMTPLTSTTSWVMEVGLLSNRLSLMDLTTVAKWVVKRRLLAVPGVANVSIFGAMTRQIQIQINPQKLIQHNIAITDVIGAARQATAIRGAGFVTTANQRIILQTEGQPLTPGQIAQTVLVRHGGANLTLGDVANIVNAPAPPTSGASVDGHPALDLVVESQYGANTLQVTHGIDAALAELRPDLTKQGIQIDPNVFRPADFIVTSLDNVRSSLEIGAVLVIAVLFLFLFNFRTAAISCAAIPLSLLGAVIALVHTGQSVNTLTLGGLAIAIGEVVDDAVIDVENIYRRLRENRVASHPKTAWRVVLSASVEVRSAVVYATFAVILVFFPILTLSGVAGRLFSPLGMAYIWAILISLLVALTVTPALCMVLLGNRDVPPLEPPFARVLKRGYHRVLLGVERWPKAVMTVVVVVILTGIFIVPELKTSFLPQLHEGSLTLHMTMMPGTSIRQSVREGKVVSEALLRVPYVKSIALRIGRAELSTDTYGTNAGELPLAIKAQSGSEYEAAMDQIQKKLAKIPGAAFSINSFLVERINETLSGYSSGVAVNVFGSDLGVLDEKAQEVAQALSGIRGVSGVRLQSPPGMPQVVVRLRPQAVERWGFDPVQVLNAIRTAYSGEITGQIYQSARVFDVSVILNPRYRRSISAISQLPLRGPDGNYVPLGQLADIYESSGRFRIQHEGARRLETVTCNVAGGDLNAFLSAAHHRLSRISFPPGTYVAFAGAAAAQARSHRELLINSLLAALGIILLLSAVMGNYRNLLLVLLNLPFALIGGVFAVWMTHTGLSLGALVGFVTLFGITLRNSIMLLSHYDHLVETEDMIWGLDAALRGASERLAPILMTALVTGLGLLPLALGSGDPGREIEGPMAIVILGGLITSTILNLLVLPTLSLHFGRFGHSRQE